MGRIGAHLSGIERTLLNRLAEANTAATINSLRLATGQKINAPSDDPSAFVALGLLRSRLSASLRTAEVQRTRPWRRPSIPELWTGPAPRLFRWHLTAVR